ncbi:MAG: hypothetical protein AAF541_12220 [Pseudomonadota bacterium]
MSIAELYEVYFAAQDVANQLLQFLITISFAVVIVTYAASNRLTGILYLIIGAVYSITYAMLVIRMSVHFGKAYETQNRLIELGENFADLDEFLTALGILSAALIYLSAIGFLVYGYTKRADL